MNIQLLKAFTVQRRFQACQTLAQVCFAGKNPDRILIYDASNGHWLDPTDNMREVGYLTDCRLGAKNLKVKAIMELISNPSPALTEEQKQFVDFKQTLLRPDL